MSDDNDLAPNIITYVGVPLAVLGVLPILYNVVRTTSVYFAIRQRLIGATERNQDIELTNDYFGGEVEVRLSAFRVAPVSRNDPMYWKISFEKNLPGGSWEMFNWNRLPMGQISQRLKSADKLRQLQVEVSFEDLIVYLLDLGSIPESHGWKSLRLTGIWTSKDTKLMVTSLERQPVLTIADFSNSFTNGKLSLQIETQSRLVTRDKSFPSPDWVSLHRGYDNRVDEHDPPVRSRSSDTEKQQLRFRGQPQDLGQDQTQYSIGSDGAMLIRPPEISIGHLTIHRGTPTQKWWPSIFAAYASSQHVLTKYRIPHSIIDFAHSCTVPCGILVLLGFVEGSDAPDWEKPHPYTEIVSGSRQSPSLSAGPQTKADVDDLIQRMGETARHKLNQQEIRVSQALQSRGWNVELVAQHTLQYLNQKMGLQHSLEDMVVLQLYRAIHDVDFGESIGAMLDLWRSWSGNGGMRRADLATLQHDTKTIESFACSTLLLALILDTEGTTMSDMQTCFDTWKDVRLG